MEMIWCGTASLILREQGTVIAFDPFGKLPVHGFSKKIHHIPHEKEYREATDVFVTHGHFDHIYHIPQIYRDRRVRIYCTNAPAETLEKHGIPDMEIVKIAPGWSGDVGPFHITAYQGRHCKFDLPMVFEILRRPQAWRHFFYSLHLATMSLSYPENKEILLYEVKLYSRQTSREMPTVPPKGRPDGKGESEPKGALPEESTGIFGRRAKKATELSVGREPKVGADFRIQIMGSMNLDPNVTYPTGADVLVLPLQGRSDQDEYAVQFVERLRPKLVLLDHYDDAFPPISKDVDVSGFVRNVEERLRIPCRAMKEGEILLRES
ncbi:MAG: MBL fold metallo-hydrolase [Lachnospiraceae bacterium]|nr:MBL fold metallo-hydrolase [Lachnospiraceae bacterium]